MSFSSIWCLESHFPMIDDIIAIFLFVVIPWHFARIHGQRVEGFWIPIDCFVKIPVEMTRTFPEFYRVALVNSKKAIEFTEYSHCMTLVRMWWGIKYLFCCMDGIGDDYNLEHIFFDTGLVNTTPNRKEFSFSAHDKSHMM